MLLNVFLGCSESKDTPVKPVISIGSGNSYVETDENQIVSISISLDIPATVAGSINVQTEDFSAEAGSDFIALNETISWNVGDQTISFDLTIIGDTEYEQLEEFFINFSNPVSAELNNSRMSILITDNDEEPTDPEVTIPTTGYTTPESYAGMTLIWQDEFTGDVVNEDFWTFEIGNGSSGWGNNELQYYRKENTYIKEENLVIEAKQEFFSGSNYTSSRMITKDKFDFQYGRVDIRAALPKGQGIWPALWMLGANFSEVGWPYCGEIDIMEMVGGSGRENTVHGTLHWDNNGSYACTCEQGNSYTLNSGTFADEYHVFSITWDETAISWYVDDTIYKTVDITPAALSEFRDNFFFIFNVAVGGNWPGSPNSTTVFPQRMIVDYVRVFQEN